VVGNNTLWERILLASKICKVGILTKSEINTTFRFVTGVQGPGPPTRPRPPTPDHPCSLLPQLQKNAVRKAGHYIFENCLAFALLDDFLHSSCGKMKGVRATAKALWNLRPSLLWQKASPLATDSAWKGGGSIWRPTEYERLCPRLESRAFQSKRTENITPNLLPLCMQVKAPQFP